MLVTASFFDYCDIDVAALQERRDRALVASAKHLITALEAASQRADALAYQLQDYVDREREAFISEAFIEQTEVEEKPKAKRKNAKRQ